MFRVNPDDMNAWPPGLRAFFEDYYLPQVRLFKALLAAGEMEDFLMRLAESGRRAESLLRDLRPESGR